jgi:hypothetical protein
MGISLDLESYKIKRTTFFLLCFKLLYCFYGIFIFGNLSPLGDSGTYLNSPIVIDYGLFRNNTLLTSTFTAVVKKIFLFDIFVHLVFCLMSFGALKLVLDTLKFSQTKTYILILLLSFPSFGMWTSVVSKEVLTCVFTCFNLVWIINLLRDEKLKYSIWINLIFLYFTMVMRPSVGVGVALFIGALYFNKIVWINKYIRFLAMIFSIFSSAIIVYVLTIQYVQDSFIPLAEAYFDPRYYSSTSTREFGFWKTASDLYSRAPYGIFLANLGPTFLESLKKPFFIPYFFEGVLFILINFYFVSTTFISHLWKEKIKGNFILFLIFGLFVILFINYPFQIYNPGSALRYRSSYYHIVIILLFFFYQREHISFRLNK